MGDAISVRLVCQRVSLRIREKEVIFDEAEERVEHIDDFVSSANSPRYNVILCVARQVFEHILDGLVSSEPTFVCKTPTSALDNGNQPTNCNMVQS